MGCNFQNKTDFGQCHSETPLAKAWKYIGDIANKIFLL